MMHRTGHRRWFAAPLLLIGLACGCGDSPPASNASSSPPARAVRVEVVTPREVVTSLRVPGLVEAAARIELAFRVTGFVARFDVDAGDRVEVGQVLAELESEEFERAVRSAHAALARVEAQARDAEQTFRRQQRLLAESTTSQQTLDRARTAHDVARARRDEARVQLEEAEDRLAKATLRAPVAGLIERRLLEPHELATEQTPVLVLTQLETVKVRAAVADARAAELRPGAPALVTTPLQPGHRFEGRIARIDLAADPGTRTVPFEVELPNPELALRPELVVDVVVPTGEPEMLVLVPLACVLRDVDTRPFCLVVDGEGEDLRAARRPVELGAIHGERVAVAAGLVPDERLVVRGEEVLRPGDRVRVVEGD